MIERQIHMLFSRLVRSTEDYDNPRSLGNRFRLRRLQAFMPIVEHVYNEKGAVHILDIGGTYRYWKHLISQQTLADYAITITIVNTDQPTPSTDSPHFKLTQGDGRHLSFKDDEFDIVHSNSVIEHVGNWQNMTAFAGEVQRLGTWYFVQTPHFWFPYEPHFLCPFFHWFPKPWRINLLMRFTFGAEGQFSVKDGDVSKAVLMVDHARLLNKRMFVALFPDATITTERFLGLPKSLMAIRSPAL